MASGTMRPSRVPPAAEQGGAQQQPFSTPLQYPQREKELTCRRAAPPAAVPVSPSLAHGTGSRPQLLQAVSEPAHRVPILCAERTSLCC